MAIPSCLYAQNYRRSVETGARAIFALIAVFTFSITYGQSPSNLDSDLQPSPPKPEKAADSVPPDTRAARDRMFNLIGPSISPSVESRPDSMPPDVTSASRMEMSELPVDKSDTILIGTVVDVQSHVTNTRNHIYTELTIKPQELFRDTTKAVYLKPTLDIDEPGGAIVLSNGKVVRHIIKGYGRWPVQGGKYLFFLMRVPGPADCFRLLKAWELKDGKSLAMAGDDLARAHKGISTFDGMPVAQLQAALNLAIAAVSR